MTVDTATNISAALDWLRLLYSDETGHGVLWTRQGRQSHWFSTADLEAVGALAARLAERSDVYFGVGLHPRPLGPGERGRSGGVSAIPGLWLDLDVAGPGHQSDDLPPDRTAARRILEQFPLAPSAVVDSGYGLHCWWLFPEPWRFSSPAEHSQAAELSKRFQATLCGIGRRLGWHVDSTHDLARVLRLPGTFNRKLDQPVPVEVVDLHPDRRYRPEDFEPHLVPVEVVNVPAPAVEGDIGAQHRNTTLTSLAGSMRKRGLGADEIAGSLLVVNRNRCRPPLAEAEVRAIADSVAAYAPGSAVAASNGHRVAHVAEPPPGDEDAPPEDYAADYEPAGKTEAGDSRPGPAPTGDDLFRLWPAADLLDADRSFRWLMRGLLVAPTYGMLAGERKTLKSYLATFINVAVATGVPLFGQFAVDEPMPVVTYVGEGGRIPYTRRLERVAAAMDIDLRHLPLFSSFDVAPVQSQIFAETMARDLRTIEPGLLTLDPLYAFHGASANASNLFEEGTLLSSMSAPCVDAGASLLVLSHFNKTGGGRGLDRITQAGGQEWSDTWILLSHRAPPDVAAGHFRLLLEVGSRQWGGTEWDLDLNVGRFEVELGEFDGDITWDLRRHRDVQADSLEAKVLAMISAHPYQLTREDLAKGMGGNLAAARAFLADLESKGAIGVRQVSRERSDGRLYKVWAFHLNHASSEPGRCETTDGEECA